MGKSVGLLGPISGKVGNTVGYTLKEAKQSQGWRVYQPVVKNPQTDLQLDQRVKLNVVNMHYRQIKEIILRGQENTAYGYPARKAWLSRALGAAFIGPWLPKGADICPPLLNIAMTYGSLPQCPALFDDDEDYWTFPTLGLTSSQPVSSIADISQVFIAAGYREGDQVTFVYAWNTQNDSVDYSWVSFYIDSSNTALCYDALGITFDNDESILRTDSIENMTQLINSAMFVTVSRDGDGSHLRSTSYWTLTPAMESMWYGSTYTQAAARRSYKKDSSRTSNWMLDPTEGLEVEQATLAMRNSTPAGQIYIDGWRAAGQYAQVHDRTNNVWRYVYNEDIKGTPYHKWLGVDRAAAGTWQAETPSGAVATDAVRFIYTDTATDADVAFANWLVDECNYDIRYLLGIV